MGGGMGIYPPLGGDSHPLSNHFSAQDEFAYRQGRILNFLESLGLRRFRCLPFLSFIC
jgi:hypothetical protein